MRTVRAGKIFAAPQEVLPNRHCRLLCAVCEQTQSVFNANHMAAATQKKSFSLSIDQKSWWNWSLTCWFWRSWNLEVTIQPKMLLHQHTSRLNYSEQEVKRQLPCDSHSGTDGGSNAWIHRTPTAVKEEEEQEVLCLAVETDRQGLQSQSPEWQVTKSHVWNPDLVFVFVIANRDKQRRSTTHTWRTQSVPCSKQNWVLFFKLVIFIAVAR